jgi:hypothetical protein
MQNQELTEQEIQEAIAPKAEISETTFNFAKSLAKFYLDYCNTNDIKLENIVANKELVKDEKYKKSIILLMMLNVLKDSNSNEEFAILLNSIYNNFKSNGFTHYQSIENMLTVFDVEFEGEELLPRLTFNENVNDLEFPMPEDLETNI